MIFAVVWVLVVMVSWAAFPAWRGTPQGAVTLIAAAAVGVIAFLKDSAEYLKSWFEAFSAKGGDEVGETSELADGRASPVPWEQRDAALVKQYFALCSKYSDKSPDFSTPRKQVDFFLSLGLVKKVKGSLYMTQAGVLLFCGKEHFPHTVLHADTILRNEEQGLTQEISGSILETYFAIYDNLRALTVPWRNPGSRDAQGQEEELVYYPDVAITEALVNFFIHRDYLADDLGYITLFADRIELVNPGKSPYPPEELLAVKSALHPAYRRNPRLVQALRKTGLNQREGLGILRIKEELDKNKSYDPQGGLGIFIENDEAKNRFRLVLYKKVPAPLKPKKPAAAKLMIVEDDPEIAEMLGAYFNVQGYETIVENWGKDGLRAAHERHPDVIILDINLPDIDGFEVACRLRKHRETNAIPIIFLTERRRRSDRLIGLELGADDYVTKPFDIEELRLRVGNALKRSRSANLSNPITGWPDTGLLKAKLSESLNSEASLLVISIERLAAFNEKYGFVAADEVLRDASRTIQTVVLDSDLSGPFLGHLSSSALVIMATEGDLDSIQDQVLLRLSRSMDYLYRLEGRQSAKKEPDDLAIKAFIFSLTPGRFQDGGQIMEELLKRVKYNSE